MAFKGRVCARCRWDESVPNISFDENGRSSYCRLQEKLMSDYPKGAEGLKAWEGFVKKMKERGKGRTYDCIVGVSGGTDSSYLLHICHREGLRVLAVNLDNGWSSDVALQNIKNVTS